MLNWDSCGASPNWILLRLLCTHVTIHFPIKSFSLTSEMYHFIGGMTSNRKLVLLSRHKCYKTKLAQHIIIPEILCTWSPDLVLALPFILRAFCMQAVWPTQRWPFFSLFLPYFPFLDTKIQINKLLTITFRKYIHYIAHLATQHQKRGDFRKTPLASSLTDV